MFNDNQLVMPSTMPSGVDIRRQTLSERLNLEKKRLQERLDEVNATLSLLEANPQVQQVFDQLSKINLY